MRFNYTNTLNDIVDMHVFLANEKMMELNKVIKSITILYYIICIALIFYIAQKVNWNFKIVFKFSLFVIMVLLILSGVIFYSKKLSLKKIKNNCKLLVRENPNLLMPYDVILDKNKLIIKNNNSKRDLSLSFIKKVVEAKDVIYILDNNDVVNLIIPDRAFNSSDKQEFIKLIEASSEIR